MNNFRNLRPFPWFCMNNFPFIEQTFDEINIWNLLGRVVGKLNEVIENTNKMGGQVEDLTILVNQLKEYMEHYFDNLDVQEEINNKLDDMVESGELEEIIATYLNTKAVFGFDNVSSMKSATNLIDGSFAETLGYYSKNDGGSALYKIRNITNNDIVDEGSIIALSNPQLVAELIVNNCVNVKQFGAKVDGTTDDTTALQNALNYSKQLIGVQGTLIIKEPINIEVNTEKLNLDFKNMIIKCNSNNIIDYCIKLQATSNKRIRGNFKNLVLDSNGKSKIGLYIQDTSQLYMDNMEINSATESEFKIDNEGSLTSTVFMNNIRMTCGYEQGLENCSNASAMLINSPDSHFSNIVTLGYIKHIVVNKFNFFEKIHCWNDKEETINNSTMFKVTDTQIITSDCYCDTLQTMFECFGVGSIDAVNPLYYLNPTYYLSTHNSPTPILIDNDYKTSGRIRITGGRFRTTEDFPTPDFINYDVTNNNIRLRLLRILNTHLGTYKVSPYFLDYESLNLDLTANTDDFTTNDIYNKECVISHGILNLRVASTVAGVSQNTYVTLATINNDIVVPNNQSFIAFLRNYATGDISPILARITNNKEIQINIPNNVVVGTSNAIIIEHTNSLLSDNNLYI